MSFGGLGSTGLSDLGLGAPNPTNQTYDVSLGLTQTSTVTLAKYLDFNTSITANSVSSITEICTLDADGSISLPNTNQFILNNIGDFIGDTTLGISNNIHLSNMMTIGSTLVVDSTNVVDLTNSIDIVQHTSFGISNTLFSTALIDQYEQNSLSTTSFFTSNAIIDISSYLSIPVSNNNSYVGFKTVDTNISIGQITTFNISDLLDAVGSIKYESNPNTTGGPPGAFDFNRDFSTNQTASMLPSDNAEMLESTSLSSIAGLSSSVAISINKSLNITSSSNWLSLVTLDASASQTDNIISDFSISEKLDMVAFHDESSSTSISAENYADLDASSMVLSLPIIVPNNYNEMLEVFQASSLASYVPSNIITIVESLPLDQNANIIQSNGISIPLDFTTLLNAGMSYSNNLDLQEGITLNDANASIDVDVIQEHEESVPFAVNNQIDRTSTWETYVSLPNLSQTSAWASSSRNSLFEDEDLVVLSNTLLNGNLDIDTNLSFTQNSTWQTINGIDLIAILDFDSHPSAPDGPGGEQLYNRSLLLNSNAVWFTEANLVMREVFPITSLSDHASDGVKALLSESTFATTTSYEIDIANLAVSHSSPYASNTTWILNRELGLNPEFTGESVAELIVNNNLELRPSNVILSTPGIENRSQSSIVGYNTLNQTASVHNFNILDINSHSTFIGHSTQNITNNLNMIENASLSTSFDLFISNNIDITMTFETNQTSGITLDDRMIRYLIPNNFHDEAFGIPWIFNYSGNAFIGILQIKEKARATLSPTVMHGFLLKPHTIESSVVLVSSPEAGITLMLPSIGSVQEAATIHGTMRLVLFRGKVTK